MALAYFVPGHLANSIAYLAQKGALLLVRETLSAAVQCNTAAKDAARDHIWHVRYHDRGELISLLSFSLTIRTDVR